MAPRAIEVTRALFGASLLLAPRPMLVHVHRVHVDRTSILVARVLGARQLGQALLSGLRPSPEVLAMGIWVDVAHGASAVGLAAVDRQRAFAGLLNAGAAAGWAADGYRTLVRGPVADPSHERRRDRLARWTLGHLPGGPPLLRVVDRRRSRTTEGDERRGT